MKYYTLEMIWSLYRQEYPDISSDELFAKAKELHKSLNTMDIRWRRSNRKYYSHTDVLYL